MTKKEIRSLKPGASIRFSDNLGREREGTVQHVIPPGRFARVRADGKRWRVSLLSATLVSSSDEEG